MKNDGGGITARPPLRFPSIFMMKWRVKVEGRREEVDGDCSGEKRKAGG